MRDNTGMRTIALEEHFSPGDKAKIAGGNAERVLGLKPSGSAPGGSQPGQDRDLRHVHVA